MLPMPHSGFQKSKPNPPVLPPVHSIQATPVGPPTQPEFPSGYNFALAKNGAVAAGGKDPQLLIDGEEKYDGGTGFGMTYWQNTPTPFFTVTLKKPVLIDCIRFLLWDLDDRSFRYKLEVCADEQGKDWTMIADRSAPTDFCKSWQNISFKAQTIKIIKLTGTYNSANNGFHVVELQAFFGAPAKRLNDDSLDF